MTTDQISRELLDAVDERKQRVEESRLDIKIAQELLEMFGLYSVAKRLGYVDGTLLMYCNGPHIRVEQLRVKLALAEAEEAAKRTQTKGAKK